MPFPVVVVDFSKLDLKALSEPACKLIDAIRSAVGIAYEPTRIRGQAKAEADANIILAKNRVAVRDIEVRATERLINRELRRQKNIEQITQKAIVELPATVSDDPTDQDWIAHFFQQCQDISNEQMQSLWARLLAGEVAKPGSFSLRTLNIVKVLAPTEANFFTRLSGLLWTDGDVLCPIVNMNDAFYRDAGFPLADLLELQTIGLIEISQSGFYVRPPADATSAEIEFGFFGRRHRLVVPSAQLHVGNVTLTSTGQQLAPIAGASPNEDYRCHVVDLWRRQGITVTET
jgi:hypothetical protein